jgi:hypothetical protein
VKIKINNQFVLASAFLALLFVVMFRDYVTGSAVLMTTDAAISSADRPVGQVLATLYSNWDSGALLGGPLGSVTQHGFALVYLILGGILWNNTIYGLACLAASLVLLAGLRNRVSVWAALCGAIAAFWLGSNLTLIYSGHFFKPFVVLFFLCAVFSARIASWPGGVLWGGFTGLMFAHQPDVAMLFALFAGAHLLFSLWQREGGKVWRWIQVLVPALAVSLLFAAGPLLAGYKYQVKDVAVVQQESKVDRWNYMTQWSWPPEESINFIAPGYSGWASGDPEGPYWGRKGRSADWEKSHQGSMNFSLNNTYIGFIPIAFALFAVFASRRSPHRPEILFWGIAALAALLLAFGKYFPLYSWFYQLPIVNNIRAPDKFNQVFQVAIGLLTAYGVDLLIFRRTEVGNKKDRPPELVPRGYFMVLAVVSGLLLLWALGLSSGDSERIRDFMARGWPEGAASTMVMNQMKSLWHAVVMAAISLAVFALYKFKTPGGIAVKGTWLAVGLSGVLAVDAVLLSSHYVKRMPSSYIQSNALTQYLKDHLGYERVALLTQQDIYNVWLTYLLPYNQIPSFNFSQMPRMASDYKTFLSVMAQDPFRMWRFAGVKYLLGPTSFERKLPPGQVRKVFTYSLAMTSDNELQVIPYPKGDHAVYELMNSAPRYSLIAPMPRQTDEQALARMADSRQPLMGAKGAVGAVEVLAYRPGKVALKTRSGETSLLRVAERWDADWAATVDGKPAPVERVDFLCQGVEVPSGEHTVVLNYTPALGSVYMQGLGYLALVAGVVAVLKRRKPG